MNSSLRRSTSELRRVSVAALAAVGLVVSETILSYGLGEFDGGPLLLLAAVGLAFVPFLPVELRRLSLVVPLVPVLAVVIAPLALVSAATVGIPLTGTSIRLIALGLTLLSLALSAFPSVAGSSALRWGGNLRTELGTLIFLAAIVVLGVSLSEAVVGGPPVPGPDWGHYLLYSDRIRAEHALLIDNPFWMGGGLPFPQDPGAPSLYGAFLLVGGGSAGALVQGIWLFSLLGILSVFVFCAGLWGGRAGLVAAALWAVLPAGLNALSWHGLAQTYALALLPLAALCVGAALRGWLGWRWALLLATSGLAILGAHRVTALVVGAALLPPLAVAAFRRPRAGARFLGLAVTFMLVLGVGLLVHLARLYERTGGVPDYRAFLVRKVDWSLWARDLTWTVVVLGIIALIAFVVHPRTRRDPALLVLGGLLAGPIALGYAWVAHIPLDYTRMGYYIALPLVAAGGVAFGRLLPRAALPLALVPVVIVALRAHDLGPQYRAFYQLVNPTTMRGLSHLDGLAASSRGPIVADQCWAFLVPWLLQRPTLAALQEWTISVDQESKPAQTARRILYGGATGRALAARRGVRYAVLDPKCTDASGHRLPPPIGGRPVYASTRLLILELPRSDRATRVARSRGRLSPGARDSDG